MTTPKVVPYARFLRRLRALAFDGIVLGLVFYLGALIIGTLEIPEDLRRSVWIVNLFVVALYEPILVSWLGGTLGHRLTNLRVVDDRTGGNPSFFSALARTGIKAMLGWLSFLAMTFTRRHQAFHDLMTRSTVQIRNSGAAAAGHYVAERPLKVSA